MSNEVTDWIKELSSEFKAMPSDFKGLIYRLNEGFKKARSKSERKLIRIIKNRKIANNPLVNKQEIIVRHKGGSNWFTNLLLLYLCIFNTLVVIGVLSYFTVISNELPFNKLVEVSKRCDEIDCFDRFIEWVESDFPLVKGSGLNE